ncbi:hypothetical protein [Agrobacterium tumefaciens]|uniref:hypothetical protein n=1 Tax=Agrobacterium tumefaciens TaxID=358 RepID=UPI00097634A8|nr:hypothetical protein BV900_26970 [Agrobacterium tumefaciens]
MSGDYEVGLLTGSNVVRAYAVIQHLFSSVSFKEWQAATDTDHKRRDWLTVTDSVGVIRGVCYVFVTGYPQSPQMEVPVFASFSLFDEKGVARLLFEKIKQQARELKCQRIHFWPAGPKGWSIVVNPHDRHAPATGLVYDLRTVEGDGSSIDATKT